MQKFINGNLYIDGSIIKKDFAIDNKGKITFKKVNNVNENVLVYNLDGLTVLPGFIDIHVHTRNPGFEIKDNLENVNESLLFGGYTHALAMPNTKPSPNSIKSLLRIQKLLNDKLLSNVIQVGRITKKNKTIKDKKYWKNVKFVSDDGLPVINKKQMHKALKLAKKYNVQMLLHEQDIDILGYAYNSDFSKKFSIPSFASEYESNIINRDIKLNKNINAKIHIQHISTLEGVILYSKAKTMMNISAELTPHHLLLDNSMLHFDDGHFKVNPPLPTISSKKALIGAFKEEIINIIATDHAPHEEKVKALDFIKAANGFIGLESCFGLINKFIITHSLPLYILVNAMSINPGKIIGINNVIIEKNLANLTIVDLSEKWLFNKFSIKSKSFNSPFLNSELIGKVKMIIINGKFYDLR